MQRQVYYVIAIITDANGNTSILENYPMKFDSHHYNDDIDKTLRRATAEWHGVLEAMNKRDDRQLQTVVILTADGFVVKQESMGKIADLPDPEPEPEEQ